MKFLADESIDFPIIHFLRQQGLDVRAVSEEFPSKEDEFVLKSANLDNRILITSDKDFGELVYRLRKVNRGVILLRIEELYSIEKAELLLKVLLERKDELLGAFTVVKKRNDSYQTNLDKHTCARFILNNESRSNDCSSISNNILKTVNSRFVANLRFILLLILIMPHSDFGFEAAVQVRFSSCSFQ